MRLSTFDVARILAVSDSTVRNWAKKGYIQNTRRSPTGRYFWEVEEESDIEGLVNWKWTILLK